MVVYDNGWRMRILEINDDAIVARYKGDRFTRNKNDLKLTKGNLIS